MSAGWVNGAVNAWRCPDCAQDTVCVHVDEGVTPMLLACRATDGCHGMARSMGYRTRYTAADATHVWRNGTASQMKRWKREQPGLFRHCELGGLVIAPKEATSGNN